MQTTAYQNYRKQEVEGATKGKIVVLLFEGAIKFLKIANKNIDEKDIQGSHNNIVKAENILYELMSTLNMDAGEISVNLMKLYDFMIWQLIEANRDKDKNKINSVIELLVPLKDAWKEVVEKESITLVKKPVEKTEVKSINFAG
ncbi:MAG: flagellar export chaperone FliS [Deferribacterales bacterium]|nr:flagellar export chaperone FliS [Deferribacterales bacterium]